MNLGELRQDGPCWEESKKTVVCRLERAGPSLRWSQEPREGSNLGVQESGCSETQADWEVPPGASSEGSHPQGNNPILAPGGQMSSQSFAISRAHPQQAKHPFQSVPSGGRAPGRDIDPSASVPSTPASSAASDLSGVTVPQVLQQAGLAVWCPPLLLHPLPSFPAHAQLAPAQLAPTTLPRELPRKGLSSPSHLPRQLLSASGRKTAVPSQVCLIPLSLLLRGLGLPTGITPGQDWAAASCQAVTQSALYPCLC
ncbi:inosine-5-monophosphate dehydrogenase [Platysternon megacephalum]|uniref:Inosine-5-monophosphate dehydrogenase n=1 Tax=Platysternon megacephalum TaxID=55544 RepID=A0A4D9DNA7_9SAUR|nr:inosine-5-monophosphate dehydrogenase [Platysternon megacephalum]